MFNWNHTFKLLIISLFLLIIISCSSKDASFEHKISGEAKGIANEVSLSQILNEIEQEHVPPNVDAGIVGDLKRELIKELTVLGKNRFVLKPVDNPKSAVSDLRLFIELDGRAHFEWTYANLGDYNQDGAVDIRDVSPLASHFREKVSDSPTPELTAWIDGDDNGEVNISDVGIIAKNFFAEVSSYVLEGSEFEDRGFQPIEGLEISLNDATVEPGAVKRFSLEVPSLDFGYYRVVPQDSLGRDGLPSNVVPSIAEAPLIESVSPLGGLTGELVTFSAVVTGTEPIIYNWDFGGGAEPNTSEEANPTVTLSAPGTYDTAQLTVRNIAGEDTFNFTIIVGDLGGPPVIQQIIVPSGQVGDSVQFSAVVASDPPIISYTWTFSGGVDVTSSSEASPTVTFTEAGNFSGNLLVDNGKGTDTRDFNFTVNESPPPPSGPDVVSVSPLQGFELTKLLFTAEVTSSGTLTYDWDFGDLGYPQNSTEPSPTVLLGTSGPHQCSLTVTDEYGSDSLDFTVTVDRANWTIVNIARGGPYLDLEIVNGRPAVAFQLLEGGMSDQKSYAAYAISSTPDGTGTWTMGKIDTQNISGSYISLAVADSRPAVSYQASTETFSGLRYAISPTSDGLGGSWTISTVVSGSSVGYYNSLAVVDGRPRIGYYDMSNTLIMFASNDQVDGLGTWSFFTIQDTSGADICLAEISGRPAMTYLRRTSPPIRNLLQYAIADSSVGDRWSLRRTIDNGGGVNDVGATSFLTTIFDKPAVSYFDMTNRDLLFAISDDRVGSGTWSISTVHSQGDVGGNSSLASVNGYPMISYTNISGNNSLWLAMCSEPDGSGGWAYAPVDTRQDSAGGNTVIVDIGGRPGIAYSPTGDGQVRFALRDY